MMKVSGLSPLSADDPELDAQVPASVPPGPGQRHPPAPLLHLQDLRVQGVPVHRSHSISKRESDAAEDRPQPLRQGVPGHRRCEGDEEEGDAGRDNPIISPPELPQTSGQPTNAQIYKSTIPNI